MKIGIIDADLITRKRHRFPNLTSMKLSAYHKKLGDDVKLLLSYTQIKEYDKVYISKVFTDTEVPPGVCELPFVEYGGTGFFYDKAEPLPEEIEHTMPDYSLYDDFVKSLLANGAKHNEIKYYTDFSIGFTTRGCIRGCKFCVNQNYTQAKRHSYVREWLDPERKYICCLDDNVLACKDWKEIFSELNATGKKFQFKQGLDERILTAEKCEILFNSKWIGEYIFAFDNIQDRETIIKKLDMIRQHTSRVIKFYCFCGFNHEAPGEYNAEFWSQDIKDLFERIKILFSFRALPYIMRYKDYELSPYRGMYITIARWCNQPNFCKKMSFRQFAEVNGGASLRYAEQFERENPDIAKMYYDMKWGDNE